MDGDGVSACTDCDDNNINQFPGANEICDGLDNNCDAQIDEGLTFIDYWPDADGDGFGDETAAATPSCGAPPPGYVDNRLDCNDADPNFSPNVLEVCDGLDNDCNGLLDADPLGELDEDLDGYLSCEECDDTEETVYPDAVEVCDDLDNDCDGDIDEGCAGVIGDEEDDGPGQVTGDGCGCDASSSSQAPGPAGDVAPPRPRGVVPAAAGGSFGAHPTCRALSEGGDRYRPRKGQAAAAAELLCRPRSRRSRPSSSASRRVSVVGVV